ncbi:unnamed protein product [Cylicocyclus nassatus]|uniref:Uncharacterized protein n=1 Tax=Cylicocyclus nassatus TaxID=53992 RepID=A0AA36GS31_CYLNA|nr:unnamed protein product [Cylicocyclus nassatus]
MIIPDIYFTHTQDCSTWQIHLLMHRLTTVPFSAALSQDLQLDDPKLQNSAESRNVQKEDAALRTAQPCQSEYCLSTMNEFVKIKLSKESPEEVEEALRNADNELGTPLPSARPSEAAIELSDTHRLVTNMPDVQAFNEAVDRRSMRTNKA